MKKLIAIVLLLALASTAFAAEMPAETPMLEGPYIVTTCGQSPGAVMISMSAMQTQKKATHNSALTAEDLKDGEYKTLIVTTGTSMKGMGAAGTDVATEIERCLEVVQTARDMGMVIVGAHVEGMARRTDSSDAASIEAILEVSDIILIIEDSDSDGFFTQYAKDHEKPLIIVKDALAIGTIL